MENEEIWKPVVGYEGLYEVSDQGRVRGLDRQDAIGRPKKGKILKPVSTNGYLYASFTNSEGKAKKFLVHRVVLSSFIGPCPEGKEVCHRDGRRNNNRLDNLKYGTKKENMEDAIEHGSLSGSDRSYFSRIPIASVIEAQALLNSGLSLEAITEKTSLSISDVRKAVYGTVYQRIRNGIG